MTEKEEFLAEVTELLSAVTNILDGIDRREEDRDGWWETSSGAQFGADKLNAIRSSFDYHMKRIEDGA